MKKQNRAQAQNAKIKRALKNALPSYLKDFGMGMFVAGIVTFMLTNLANGGNAEIYVASRSLWLAIVGGILAGVSLVLIVWLDRPPD